MHEGFGEETALPDAQGGARGADGGEQEGLETCTWEVCQGGC